MHKLCINSRDDLRILDLDNVAYFKANGNYVDMRYITGEAIMLSIGLSKVEDAIKSAWSGTSTPFVRLGRSLIINQTFLSEINVLKQRLVLSDHGDHIFTFLVSKPLLKNYKQHIDSVFRNSKEEY